MLGLGRQGSRRRYRLQRRHAAVELPERRPPRARHRADRCRRHRQQQAASRRSSAISASTWRARSSATMGRRASSPPPIAFAHIEDVHAIVDGIVEMLAPDGVFISESHYLIGLLDTLQYDTVYHEHLRYYSVASLKHLLEMHDLEVFHARPIPSHGGSIRVYAARQGAHTVQDSVRAHAGGRAARRSHEQAPGRLQARRHAVQAAAAVDVARPEGKGRAHRRHQRAVARQHRWSIMSGSTRHSSTTCCEIPGSLKIGKCMPGTAIPVVDEARLFADQPDCAVIFSWHIADELAPKLKAKGFRGKLITPLPVPRFRTRLRPSSEACPGPRRIRLRDVESRRHAPQGDWSHDRLAENQIAAHHRHLAVDEGDRARGRVHRPAASASFITRSASRITSPSSP